MKETDLSALPSPHQVEPASAVGEGRPTIPLYSLPSHRRDDFLVALLARAGYSHVTDGQAVELLPIEEVFFDSHGYGPLDKRDL